MTRLKQLALDAFDAQLADLRAFIDIETPSDDRGSLREGLAWVEETMRHRIGPPDRRRLVGGGDHGDVLVADYLSADHAAARVVVLCHYDTVWPVGTLADWPVSITETRLSGPGAFDMKAGLVQAIWAIRLARGAGLPMPHLRLVFNGDEEIGSPVSRPVIEDAVRDCDTVLVFEPSATGRVKTARKGNGIFSITVHGVEAHAGLDPRAGVSAIGELAEVVRTLHGAADLDAGTSVNVGVISGGTRSNVIAGLATATVDVRVSNEREARRIEAVLDGLAPRDGRARLEVSGGWARPVMDRSPQIVELFNYARAIARNQGMELGEAAAGGASDGNFAAALGLPVLDGLGAVGDGAHARGEWVDLTEVTSRTVLTAEILSSLSEATPSRSRKSDLDGIWLAP